MGDIKIAIAGIGNCASSLIQGFYYYKEIDNNDKLVPGLMHNVLGGYKLSDIKVVAAFDVDTRKVGKDVSEAIFAKPNCTKIFCKDVPNMGVKVQMGPVVVLAVGSCTSTYQSYPVSGSRFGQVTTAFEPLGTPVTVPRWAYGVDIGKSRVNSLLGSV